MVRDANKLPLSVRRNSRVNLVVCDIRDCKKFKKFLNKVNFLIHTATAWGDPKRAYDVNITAFENLIEILNEKNLKKIIYFSTASILDERTDLMKEAFIYGTEYIQTKYQCYERLRKSSFSKKTCVIFPTLVFGGTLNVRSKYPISYLTEGLMQANKWLWIVRFFKLNSKFHFIHAKDIAQICGYLIQNSANETKVFKQYVLGQQFLTIDEAINILLKRNKIRRYFTIPLTKRIIKILLKVLPIQTTNWDKFSIDKYHFNHEPIANPETFGLKSHAKSLEQVINLAKLPRCNIN